MKRMEDATSVLKSITIEDFSELCQMVFPELYGAPGGQSRRRSDATPGSRQKLMALVRRYAARQDLFGREDLSC